MELTSLSTVHSRAAFFKKEKKKKKKSEEESVVVCLFERKLQFYIQISNAVFELASSLLYWGH